MIEDAMSNIIYSSSTQLYAAESTTKVYCTKWGCKSLCQLHTKLKILQCVYVEGGGGGHTGGSLTHLMQEIWHKNQTVYQLISTCSWHVN